MAGQPRPTVRRRRLGSELRRLREAAGIKMEQAAARIDGDKPKISRIENGRISVRRLEIEALLDLYGVTDRRTVTSLVTLGKESRRKSWWHQYGQNLTPDFQEWLDLEDDAVRIHSYQPLLVPGLLQTPAYAHATIRSAERSATSDEVHDFVATRMTRQAIFERTNRPQYVCILDEAVLHREIGGPGVLAAQLQKLAEVASPPELTVQVVPFNQGWHAGLNGGFSLFTYPDPMDLDVVSVQYMDGMLYLEEDESVERYRMAFDQLRASALSSRQSIELISRLARDLER
ncbi:helix-turn-helix domain-containing protein [Streptomyces alkaliterrae]|uniref:Helix-turn-helix domain-containing protein n=1 Tax=Streptomyces alkaliterrae TaxID=2213162 RepID=A0A5P0YNR0_9ACTN|nr:helix-turn-helix transcriptional regulator [Streptomyces alkaliterrae]MBB1253743.1 helix-turn-helix domain-containing protein [Streptomyces alkaliterrae]MBB1260253.1 helix-turn-helix domain-containing protein [Streptomyces alkaliterrae]MQS01911.1 helix-turn-helix domain-containing protein [Streptomyces alkaliterrae]